MERPLLSILIPTRNRQKYCINVIETILSNEYKDFELVIQDNSDSEELKDYLEKNISDNRLKYNYTPPPLSSIENFNKVIELSIGEYLCMIGDDDGINPDIFKFVEFAYNRNLNAITPSLKVIYKWPDACLFLEGFEKYNGLLTICNISNSIIKCKSINSLEKLLRNGGQNYLSIPFPKLYHGIIRSCYVKQIKKHTGSFVGGLSPDIYLSTALALLIDDFYFIDYPLTIAGACAASAPIDERINKYAKLNDAPHFRNRGNYVWSTKVPNFYCGSNILADSFLAALNDFNKQELIKKFNVYKQVFYLLIKYKNYKTPIMDFYYKYFNANHVISKIICFLRIKIPVIWYEIKSTLLKIAFNMKKILFSTYIKNCKNIDMITNIREATTSMIDYFNVEKITINDLIKRF